MQDTGESLGIALVFAAIAIPDAGERKLPVALLLRTRPFVRRCRLVQRILWHHSVTNWLPRHDLNLRRWDGLLVKLAVVVVVDAFPALTYRFVERPAATGKHSPRSMPPVPAPMPAAPLGTIDAAVQPQA